MVVTPSDLSESGKAFFRSVVKQFVMDNEPHKLQLLHEAARVVGTIEELDRARRDQPLVVPGSRPGTKQVHPLVEECRRQRQLLSVLLSKLQLPEDVGDAEVDEQREFRRQRARKAAQARWSSRSA